MNQRSRNESVMNAHIQVKLGNLFDLIFCILYWSDSDMIAVLQANWQIAIDLS